MMPVWTLTPVFLTLSFLACGHRVGMVCCCTLCSFIPFSIFPLPPQFIYLFTYFSSHSPSFWSFYNLQPIEVYKDVHGRSELFGWADSQSASKERTAQNPSRQEGTGKRCVMGTVWSGKQTWFVRSSEVMSIANIYHVVIFLRLSENFDNWTFKTLIVVECCVEKHPLSLKMIL